MNTTKENHFKYLQENLEGWNSKPLLRKIYIDFYKFIDTFRNKNTENPTVEIGSGICQIKDIIPDCICTDIFSGPGIDRVENVYEMNFADSSIGNLILFDVFHHLRFPGDALTEINRVLEKKGRLLIFDPALSVLGYFVYGLFHPEPIGKKDDITWNYKSTAQCNIEDEYAAQWNASRIFLQGKFSSYLNNWEVFTIKRLSSLSYVASGGYSMPQLYPSYFYGLMKCVDRICDLFPAIFATRLLVVLTKPC